MFTFVKGSDLFPQRFRVWEEDLLLLFMVLWESSLHSVGEEDIRVLRLSMWLLTEELTINSACVLTPDCPLWVSLSSNQDAYTNLNNGLEL